MGWFERDEMEERWVRQRLWLVVNGNVDDIDDLLLVVLVKVGGVPMEVGGGDRCAEFYLFILCNSWKIKWIKLEFNELGYMASFYL